MGKRSDFARVERDFYPTPYEAVVPLLPHLRPGTAFAEVCAGNGALISHLVRAGHWCGFASDIEPLTPTILSMDALDLTPMKLGLAWECFITNPPWTRGILHALIAHLSALGPTWLLFDADWPHTKQAIPYLHLLRKIVAVGRVKWIPDSPHTGKDNCCWYLFDAKSTGPAVFHGRIDIARERT